MNLIFRVLYVLIRSLFAAPMTDVTVHQRLTLRVLPTDLDTNWHMNNGRYLTMMDLGRLDFILRSRLLQLMLREKSVPVLAAATIRYRLDLDCFQAFHLDTRLVCWDEKWVYMEQRFIYADGPKKDVVAAIALVKGGFYNKKAKEMVPTAHLLEVLGLDAASPPFPPEVTTWITAEAALRDVTRSAHP